MNGNIGIVIVRVWFKKMQYVNAYLYNNVAEHLGAQS
jgi:hypothetical protein